MVVLWRLYGGFVNGGNGSYIVLNTLMTHANCRNGFDLIVWNYYDPSKNVDTI
jgi:hypothetical protein